jgi:hypothetical protein
VKPSGDDGTVELWDARSGAMLQAIAVSTNIQTLSFSKDGKALRTEKGLILKEFSPPLATSSQRSPPCGLFVKEQWVATGIENILWLPLEYRPGDTAVYGKTVAIGNESGYVLIFECCF